jgi:predicted exporter
LTTLNGKPLIVLTADQGNDDKWQSKQGQMARLSTNSLHRHANASHESLLDDQTDSAAASQAIRAVMAAVRTARLALAPRGPRTELLSAGLSWFGLSFEWGGFGQVLVDGSHCYGSFADCTGNSFG